MWAGLHKLFFTLHNRPILRLLISTIVDNKGGYYGKIFIVYGYSSVGKYRIRYDINLRIYRRIIMKINLFGLNKQKENWEEVDKALYQVWCINQSDVMLPKFMDADFKRCFENIKRKYSYKQICKELKL